MIYPHVVFFFFSSRRRHTRCSRDWSSDVCSSDLFPWIRLPTPSTAGRIPDTSPPSASPSCAGRYLIKTNAWKKQAKLSSANPLRDRISVRKSLSENTCLPLRGRSEEHTPELQSRLHVVCRLLLEKNSLMVRGLFFSDAMFVPTICSNQVGALSLDITLSCSFWPLNASARGSSLHLSTARQGCSDS